MPKIYRAMLAGSDQAHPQVGTTFRTLGVRVPQDIEPDATGHVTAGNRGMSVAPGLRALRPELVPKRLRHLRESAVGPDSNVVWSHGDGPFVESAVAPHLVLKPDASDHGTVAPVGTMLLEEYRSALAATQDSWIREGEW
jgi:hypothetical protein